MGIHPEAIYVESQEIFKPQILVLTNVRLDHMDQMGRTKDDIALSLASAIPKGGTVIVHQNELYPVFRRIAESKNARILEIPEDSYIEYLVDENRALISEFDENLRLSLAVAEYLGEDLDEAFRAMCGALPDFGSLKVWFKLGDPPREDWFFVSGFAANEPESTRFIFAKLRDKKLLEDRTVIGVLNLRRDRGDRTLQWFEALRKGEFPEIKKLICVGDHARAMTRKLRKYSGTEVFAWHNCEPSEMMARLFDIGEEKAVVIGMGNMGGAGKRLVDFWGETGMIYDL
jgi:poly-gamma-glutamate synthase PgsB/CapB